MSFEDEMSESVPCHVLAIPESDPILQWVRDNRPAFIPEPEFFRFMFEVGRIAIEHAKTQLETDTAGVLSAVEFH